MTQLSKVGKVATCIHKDGATTVVHYHGTPVVQWDEDHVWLDTGGWKTVTTKTRMNQVANEFGLGFSVYQSKGLWYVTTYIGGEPRNWPFSGSTIAIDRATGIAE
jgi:hypothetical protein